MAKNIPFTIFILVALLAALTSSGALAHDDDILEVSLSRVFGYSSGFGSVQGTFNITARGPDTLERVVFYIDDQRLGEATGSPFRLQFRTEDYPLGSHALSAVGYTSDGHELHSNTITTTFVSASEGMAAAGRIILPLLGVIFGAIAVSALITMVSGRGRKGSPAAPGTSYNYGMRGGTICTRCGRPFPLHFTGINLGPFHKFDRCEHCGKWGLFRRRSLEELRAAEQAELAHEQQAAVSELSEEEKLRRDLETSRYE
jgi:hypothetical protein